MSVERMLGWRFMLLGTERGRFSPMTLFAWAAIGVGTGTMCALLSVMYGLETSIRDSLLKAYPHILVKSEDGRPVANFEAIQKQLSQHPRVVRALPFVELEMIAQTEGKSTGLGVVLWGLPADELDRMKKEMEMGGPPDPSASAPQLVLGGELAHFLKAGVGSEVRLISPLKRSGMFGAIPENFSFSVSGLYFSESYELDKQYAFMLLADAQELSSHPDKISGWRVWVEDIDDSQAVAAELAAELPQGIEANSWQSFNAALFQSLKLEQWGMFLILSFAVFIAVLNVAITLMMHVTHKRRNIGILRAIGASQQSIRRIFLWQGIFLGLVGMIVGAVISFTLLALIQYVYQFPDIYYVRMVPVEVRPGSVIAVYIVATLLVVLATLYPSWRATMVDPVDAMRE
jgi:lipoprotein-releasing system permease protein